MVVDLQSAVPEPVEVAAVSYARGDLAVLEDIDVAIGQGQRLAVIGPSGCGKSTLLSLIAGLLEPGAGVITVGGGRSPAERLARCALMPQRDLLLPWRIAPGQRRRWRSRTPVSGAATPAARPLPLFGRFGLDGFEPEHAPPTSRAACGSGWRSCARCWPASRCCCWTSRSRRWTRITRRGAAGLAGGGARARSRARSCWSPTTSTRRCGLRPRGRAVAAPGPGRAGRARSDELEPRRRDGGAAIVKTAGWVAVLAGWSSPGRRTSTCVGCPTTCCRRRADRPADALGRALDARCPQACGDRPARCCSGSSRRSSWGSAFATAMHLPSLTLRRAVYAAAGGVPEHPGGRDRAAAGDLPRVRPARRRSC